MPALFVIAAALTVAPASLPQFGAAVSDAELAFAVARISASGEPALGLGNQETLIRSATAEQMDVWWAYDGAALITEAVRPRPGITGGFEFPPLADGAIQVRFTTHPTATTLSI